METLGSEAQICPTSISALYCAGCCRACCTEPKKEKRKRKTKDQEAPLGKRVKVNKSAKVHEPKTDTIPNQSPITSGHKRRKSVTFTPETKTEDGDSTKQLYNGWIAKHPTQGPNFRELRSRSTSKPSDPPKPQSKSIPQLTTYCKRWKQPRSLRR